MPRRILSVLTGLFIAGCSAGQESGEVSKLSRLTQRERHAAAWRELEENPGDPGIDYRPTRIVVTYSTDMTIPSIWAGAGLADGPGAAAAASNPILRRNQQYEPLTDAIAARFGLEIRRQVYLDTVNFASFELPEGADGYAVLSQLRSEGKGAIEHAVFAPLSYAQYVPNDPDFKFGAGGPQWSHWLVRCPDAWDVTLGEQAITIAVVDTGVLHAHEELVAQVFDPAAQFPSATCDIVNNDKTVEDTVGHGTFIAGVVCAEAENGRTIAGVAPHCKVIPIKIANAGWASIDDLIAGAFLGAELGARVVNYSWGSYYQFPLEEQMINQLVADGVLFVCAAGNDDTIQPMFPAYYDNALAVGATNSADNRAYFSNWGAYVDLAAPGQGLKSCAISDLDDYELGNGTSYAAPMVAAAAGLLWSYKPELTVTQVSSILINTGPEIDGFSVPLRRLDVADALGTLLNPIVPEAAGVSVSAGTTVGIMAGQPQLAVSLIDPVNVKRAVYTLDLAPIGTDGPEDLTLAVAGGGSNAGQLDVSALPNAQATLRAEYFSASGDKGLLTVTPVWIHNQRGDVDGDGLIGVLDFNAFQQMLGLTSADPGYVPFADSDGDGRITEADASAVGYGYGLGVVVPAISAVTPTAVWEGHEQVLTANLVGSGPLEYAWDFGGGASPNTSSLPAPTIVPGSPGDYPASLTVSSIYGSDTYDFTLKSAAKPPIEIVLDILPRVGLAPLHVYFNAHDSESIAGEIVKFEWDWDGDDSTWEQESDFYGAYHTFEELGDHIIHLRVTDDLGESAQAEAMIRVIEGLSIGSFGSTELGTIVTGSNQPASLATTEIGGRPAVCWIEKLPVESYNVAVAKVDTPMMPSNWRIDKVYTGAVEPGQTVGICEIDGEAAFLIAADGALRFGRYHGDSFELHTIPGEPKNGTLANIGGKPAVLAGQPDALHYIYATVPDPTSAADWIDIPITAPDTGLKPFTEYPFQLLEFGGGLVFHGTAKSTPGSGQDRRVVWATASPPTSTTWDSFTFEGMHSGAEQFGYLFHEGTTLSLLYELEPASDKEVRFARAALFPPTQLEHWVSHQARMPYKPVVAAGNIDGLPAFITRDDELYLALTPHPSEVTDWLLLNTPNNYEGLRLVSHGGLPALFDAEGGTGKLKYLYPLL